MRISLVLCSKLSITTVKFSIALKIWSKSRQCVEKQEKVTNFIEI